MTSGPISKQQAAVHLMAILERDGARFALKDDDTFEVRFASAEQKRVHGAVVDGLRDELGALLDRASL